MNNLMLFIVIILASWKCLDIGLYIGDKIYNLTKKESLTKPLQKDK